MASELPYQGQSNSAGEGSVKPNPQNEVMNTIHNSDGKTIIKGQAKSQSLNLSKRSMLGHSDSNQPLLSSPTMNKTFTVGTRIESHYCTIDNAFIHASEHNMDTAFITDHHEHDLI